MQKIPANASVTLISASIVLVDTSIRSQVLQLNADFPEVTIRKIKGDNSFTLLCKGQTIDGATFRECPGATTQVILEMLSIYNADTAAAVVTLKLDKNGTESILGKWTLSTGERLIYTRQAGGFDVLDVSGVKKSSVTTGLNPTSSSLQTVVLGSDQTNNNGTANTIADVTGLSFAVTAGKTYWFRFVIPYTSAATATGSRWSINGPGSPTLLNYTSHYTLTATTETNNSATAYDIPAAANASSLAAGNVAIIEGIIKPSSNGTVIARFASEISASAIVAKAGAVCFYQQVA